MAKICSNCGYPAKDTDQFCFQCGQPLETKTQQKSNATQFETQNQTELEKPLSVKDYAIIFLIMLIPIVNLVMLLMWAFDKKANSNRRNLARAGLIYMIIWYVLGILLAIVVFVNLAFHGERWIRQIQYELQDDWYDHYYDDDYYYHNGYNNYNNYNDYVYDPNYSYYGAPLAYETPNTWQDYFEISAIANNI